MKQMRKSTLNIVAVRWGPYRCYSYLNDSDICIFFLCSSAVLFEDAVVLGAANDMLSFEPMTPSVERTRRCPSLPFTTLERTVSVTQPPLGTEGDPLLSIKLD